MQTPPSIHTRNFTYGRQGRHDSHVSSTSHDLQSIRNTELSSKFLRKRQLFSSVTKEQTLNKMITDLRKIQTKVDETNWMFEQGETPQFLHNFSIHGL